MKVKDLIEMLENFDEEEEIYIKVDDYAHELGNDIYKKTLRSSWGADKEVLIIRAATQVGGV